MKITNSSMIQFESSHSQMQEHVVSETLRMQTGNQTGNPRAVSGAGEADPKAGRVNISDAGRAAQATDISSLSGIQDSRLELLRAMLAHLFGKEIDIAKINAPASRAAAANASAGGVAVYDRHESYTEAEQMSFSANGTVKTADGKSIDFSLSLSMSRSYHMESDTTVRVETRQTHDPLVINFSGDAAQLADQRFSFDLNADGNASEQINFLGSGSGFLAFDRNGDGAINDGSELFGARTGNGFSELVALDTDSNGWIDEGDTAYAHLSVWIKDAAGGDTLLSLKDANVGAISLAYANTPFSIKDANNELLGQVRAGGVYLKEDGGVGSVQQVDLTV